MANWFDAPPTPGGDEAQRLEAIYRYLQTMSDQLNEAMNGISIENFAQETREMIATATAGGNAEKEITEAKNALRSMIIKTAEVVRTEMEEIRITLEEKYEAHSELFGDLESRLSNNISTTAEGIRQDFAFTEEMRSNVDDIEGYIHRTSDYIFTGVIGYDSQSLPIVGVAIGEGITQYDQDGNPSINDNAKVATFTKDRLSFWHGSTEVAYFGDNRMYITACEVLNELKMGKYIWHIQADGSMGLLVSDT